MRGEATMRAIYNGTLYPAEQCRVEGEKYRVLCRTAEKLELALKGQLSEAGEQQLEAFRDALSSMGAAESEEAFVAGMKVGMRLMGENG